MRQATRLCMWPGPGWTWPAVRDTVAVRTLLELGADPGARNHLGAIAYPVETAEATECPAWNSADFMAAATAEAVAACLDAGREVDSRNAWGRTPLHLAAAGGDPSVVALLLAAGADPEVRDGEDATPLHLAASGGDPSIVALLLDAGREVDSRNAWGRTPLHLVAAGGDPSVVALLLEAGVDPEVRDGEDATPLHRAVSSRSSDNVSLLLAAGAELEARDSGGETPLLRALDIGGRRDSLTVAALLDAGADVTARSPNGETPLYRAVRWTHDPGVVRRLLGLGADPNGEAQLGRPLHAAAGSPDNLETVLALLEGGADVTLRDDNGNTALHTAVSWRAYDTEIALALLRAGAEADALNDEGVTPLHLAVATGSPAHANVLLQAGADANARPPGRGRAAACLDPARETARSQGLGALAVRQ